MNFKICRRITTRKSPAQFIAALGSVTQSIQAPGDSSSSQNSVELQTEGQRFSLTLSARPAWPVSGHVYVRNGRTRVSWRYPSPLHSRFFLISLCAVMAVLTIDGLTQAKPMEWISPVAMLLVGSTLLILQWRNGHPIQRRLAQLIREADLATPPASPTQQTPLPAPIRAEPQIERADAEVLLGS